MLSVTIVSDATICNIFVKRTILIINEMKWDKILLNRKFMTKKTFVEYRKIFLKLNMKVGQLSAIFQCMNESNKITAIFDCIFAWIF